MKALYTKIKKIEHDLNSYLSFFFANGNKQHRVNNYYNNKKSD